MTQGCDPVVLFAHDPDTHLVEEVDGERDDGEREDISGGSDDGSDYEDCYDGMTAVFLHEGGVYYAQLA